VADTLNCRCWTRRSSGSIRFTLGVQGASIAATLQKGLVWRDMPPDSSSQVSKLLVNWRQGDEGAREALIPLVYEELRRLARRHLRRERPDHTLQSAALVNEAYLRLIRQEQPQWQNRAHFFGVAAQLMRHILVDHARNRAAAKRGAGAPRLTLNPEIALPQERDVDLVTLDDALNQLAALDPQQSRVVELRFFGGLSIEETSIVLGISPATVKREWATARAWLRREMKNKSKDDIA
jgi:RNA polymerase sigma factor (TIGR02999 family)